MATAEVKKSQPTIDCSRDRDINGGVPKSVTFARGGKPIILSSQRYNKIVNNATTTDRSKALKDAEIEQRKRDQLKAGNEQLVAKFKGNMPRTQDQKLQQIKEETDKKTKQGVADYERAKENEAQKRHEKIAKAQQIVQKLKPGPRELHSAVLQSEVLRARNVQRSINEEFEKAIKKQDSENKKQINAQAMTWISDEQQRLAERQKSNIAYKQELLKTISENQNRRSEQKKQMIKEQQAARDATDAETKAQIEKENALMEKKRTVLRKNALEAMKMVEQRRLRDRMVDEVEDRLCCVYNAGKLQMDALLAEQTKKLAADQQKKIEEEVKKLSSFEDKVKTIDSERIRRDISTMQLKFTAEEQEKVRKDKAAKQARIEAYLKEREYQKEAQRRLDEQKRFDMAQRFKNTEINCMFDEAQKKERNLQILDVRKQLNQQMDENKRNQLSQKQANVTCGNDTLDDEHKFFFDHARNLMEDAQKQGRPVYPFVKVVQQYKRDNQIDCDRKIPKHLESQVPIGQKSAPANNNDKTLPTPAGKTDSQFALFNDKNDKTAARASVLENCLKINEIIESEKASHDKTPYKCPQDDKVTSGSKSIKGMTSKEENAAVSPALSAKLCYSMQELKKMNQFAAPTCY